MTKKLAKADTEEEMYEAFLVLDRDRSGCVTGSELRQAMVTWGFSITEDEVDDMIEMADADGDGELSFDDFMQFIIAKGLFTPTTARQSAAQVEKDEQAKDARKNRGSIVEF